MVIHREGAIKSSWSRRDSHPLNKTVCRLPTGASEREQKAIHRIHSERVVKLTMIILIHHLSYIGL